VGNGTAFLPASITCALRFSATTKIAEHQGGSGRVATIPHFVRLDFAYASQTVFYVMAGLMAAAGVVAMLGLRPGRQQELSEAKRGASDEALEVARALPYKA
jgi:hypothetical protein